MEVLEACGSKPSSSSILRERTGEKNEIRVQMKALRGVLDKCQRTLESLSNPDSLDGDENSDDNDGEEEDDGGGHSSHGSSSSCRDRETEELCDMIKSRVIEPDFLEKLQKKKMESNMISALQTGAEEGSSWDVVCEHDLWEGGNTDLDQEYVLVRQEDIVDGIACFMAAYLLSLEQSKDLTPDQLQQALSKAFSVKKKKGKLRKALDGSKVIYNVASWSATAIGIYQNPALLRAASTAFWASCRIISKLF